MKITLAATIASALLFAAGCANEEHQTRYDQAMSPSYSSGRMRDYNGSNDNMPLPSAPRATSGSESDNRIVSQVRESLQRNPEIAVIMPAIQISANNGAVVLNGSVQSEEQRRQIESIAQQAPGVFAVNNQLRIFPSPASRESDMGNQLNSPPLNATSNGSNSLPRLYKDANDVDNGSVNSSSNAVNSTPHLNGDNQMP